MKNSVDSIFADGKRWHRHPDGGWEDGSGVRARRKDLKKCPDFRWCPAESTTEPEDTWNSLFADVTAMLIEGQKRLQQASKTPGWFASTWDKDNVEKDDSRGGNPDTWGHVNRLFTTFANSAPTQHATSTCLCGCAHCGEDEKTCRCQCVHCAGQKREKNVSLPEPQGLGAVVSVDGHYWVRSEGLDTTPWNSGVDNWADWEFLSTAGETITVLSEGIL